jgi:hypothetical protein
MVGPASARHARTEARAQRGGETIFSLRGGDGRAVMATAWASYKRVVQADWISG